MAVRHGVTDTDRHFIIDPITRTIKNQSGKLVLIQYDHNSERFTFECPRHVDEHDMSLSDKVEIHYINTGTGNSWSSGIYEADDLRISADNTDVVTFSWLISQNATQHVGKLNFIIRFTCVGDDATLEYAWNTGIYSDIAIAKSIYNGEEFVEEYIDVLEMWKQDLYSVGLKITSVEQTTTSNADGGTNVVTMRMTDGSARAIEIRNGSKGTPGNSIKSIKRTSGNGSSGSIDTYTVTLTDDSTTTFQVYNGTDGLVGISSNGMQLIDSTTGGVYKLYINNGNLSMVKVEDASEGSGGMQMVDSAAGDTYTLYIEDGKLRMARADNLSSGTETGTPSAFVKVEDISDSVTTESSNKIASSAAVKAAYDKAVEALTAAENGSGDGGSGAGGAPVTVDAALSDSSVNPVQNKIVKTALDDKQDKTIGVEIIETICKDVVFNDNKPTYNLPYAITLDSNALYYMDCYYYDGSVDGDVNERYSIHAYSRVSSDVIKWGSYNDGVAITLDETSITNNWRSSGCTNIVSIYKVKNVQVDPSLVAALQSTGYMTVAPGGYNARAEGHRTIALGYAAHAQGRDTYAFGDYSHAEGQDSRAYGSISHAQGRHTIATCYVQHVEGAFNIVDTEEKYIHIVGNGESDSERSNAHTLDWEGNAWFAGNVNAKEVNVINQLSVVRDGNNISIWPSGISGNGGLLWIDCQGEGYFTKLCIGTSGNYKAVATIDDITAAITGAIEGSY